MLDSEPIARGEFVLRRMEGKGGWTYVLLPGDIRNPGVPFGWLKITGRIDDYDLGQMKLMPVKGGGLFLPVKAAIRKAIGKEAGDMVQVLLYADTQAYGIPEEVVDCLKLGDVYEKFTALPEGAQKQYVDWIYDARTDDTKVKRIGEMIGKLQQ